MMQPSPASNRIGIAALGMVMVCLAIAALNAWRVMQ